MCLAEPYVFSRRWACRGPARQPSLAGRRGGQAGSERGHRASASTTSDRWGPTYSRGAQPEGRDYADLAALGIKTVIDLQADGEAGEQQLVESAGMRFHRIP